MLISPVIGVYPSLNTLSSISINSSLQWQVIMCMLHHALIEASVMLVAWAHAHVSLVIPQIHVQSNHLYHYKQLNNTSFPQPFFNLREISIIHNFINENIRICLSFSRVFKGSFHQVFNVF
jgi:hypothetical protein